MSESVAAKGPFEPDLSTLTPKQFEDLVFLLAHAEEPRVVPVRAKDQGLDARLPAGRGRTTARGWQAKRHAEIKWANCRESIRSALAFWRPPRITFAFAIDLSTNDQEKFRTELVEGFPQIQLDFWGATEIKRRMREGQAGLRAQRHFFPDKESDIEAVLRTIRQGGKLDNADEGLGLIGAVSEAMRADPHFAYGVTQGEVGRQLPDPAGGTVASFESEEDGTAIRVDVSERHPGAAEEHGPEGAIGFATPEAAAAAQAEIERARREGDTAVLEDALVRMNRIPRGLEGVLSESMEAARVELTPLPARQRKRAVEVILETGGLQYAIDLSPIEASEEIERGAAGGFGGIMVTLLSRKGATEPELALRYSAGIGTTLEQLGAVQIILATYARDDLVLRLAEGGGLIARAIPSLEDDPEGIRSLGARAEALGALAELEAWTGRQFSPGGNWEAADLKRLFAAVTLIRRPLIDDAEGFRLHFEMKPEAPLLGAGERHQFVLIDEPAVELFGGQVDLGTRMIHFAEGVVDRVEEESRRVEVVPAEGSEATLRLFAPGETPPLPPRPNAD